MAEFSEPTSIIIKHTNPCGVASSDNITNAFIRSYKSDFNSAFGGIIFLNRKVDLQLAKQIHKNFLKFHIFCLCFFYIFLTFLSIVSFFLLLSDYF